MLNAASSNPLEFLTGTGASRPLRAPSGATDLAVDADFYVLLALRARGGRDARGPSQELDPLKHSRC
jgi:hypothetical protein